MRMSAAQFYWFEKLFILLPVLFLVLLALVLYRVMVKPRWETKRVKQGRPEAEDDWPPPPNKPAA